MENSLVLKIAKAALEVGGKLETDKTNKEQGYGYISADKILSVCGQALFSNGVVVIPDVSGQDYIVIEYIDNYGKSKKRYDALVTFKFFISDGMATLEQSWFGRGSDYSTPDKAMYKAITSGHKYFLAKLLCIGVGNEDNEHEDEPQVKQVSQPANGKQSKPAATAPVVPEPTNEQKDNQKVDWLPEALFRLAKEYDQPTNRIANALAYSNLVKPSNYEDMAAWMKRYRAARDEQMDVKAAGEKANQEA